MNNKEQQRKERVFNEFHEYVKQLPKGNGVENQLYILNKGINAGTWGSYCSLEEQNTLHSEVHHPRVNKPCFKTVSKYNVSEINGHIVPINKDFTRIYDLIIKNLHTMTFAVNKKDSKLRIYIKLWSRYHEEIPMEVQHSILPQLIYRAFKLAVKNGY